MSFNTFITTKELAEHLDDPDLVIVDARFVLTAPERGEQNYHRSHIPGAVYAHLDRDLSASIIPGKTGRHPWPSIERAAAYFSEISVGQSTQVVAYDDAGGALAASRVWGVLRWLGHEQVAVLDGGWQQWVYEELAVSRSVERKSPQQFSPQIKTDLLVDADHVEVIRKDPAYRLFDARGADRYRGENENIDPVAGHIPGAISAPYLDNLCEDGRLRSVFELRRHYKALLGETSPERVIFYCGSGVTSLHSVMAMEYTGLGGAKVYAGSWSDWIASGTRPVAI